MSDPTPPPAAPKHPRADQDTHIADRISAAQEIIATAQSDAELLAALATRGFDAAKMTEGTTLQQAAQAAFTARTGAMAHQDNSTNAFNTKYATAHDTYRDFRDTVRKELPASMHGALGVNGNIPKDLQKFLTVAIASYDAALNTPDALALLTTFGFDQQALTAARNALTALVAADSAQQLAIAAAVNATAARDAAVAALDAWMRAFKAIYEILVRHQPEFANRLNFS